MAEIKEFQFSREECEILNEVLWEIEEFMVFEGEDKEALDNLKSKFEYGNIQEMFDR